MRELRGAIATVVAVFWSLAVVEAVVRQDVAALGVVTPVMMVIVTALFVWARNGGDEHDRD